MTRILLIFFEILLSCALFSTAHAADNAKPESLDKASWKHESELGVIIAGGNTESRTENAKHKSAVEWHQNVIKAFGNYTHNFTDVETTETDFEIWGFGARYERVLSEKVDVFFGNDWNGDRNAGVAYRSNVDIGAKYKFYTDAEKQDYLFTELGYRFSYEKKVDSSDSPIERSHIVRSYTEWGKKLNASVTLKYWLELLPDLSDSDNLQINTEPSITVVLTSLLSLKVAYLVKYDNEPAADGAERIDYLYTTTLVAKY